MARNRTVPRWEESSDGLDTPLPPPPVAKAPREKKPVRKTVELLARETGNIRRLRFSIDMGGSKPNPYSPAHRTAARAHGWDERARQGYAPLMLTKEDYLAALKAAQGCDKHGAVCTHAPALCPDTRLS